MNGWFWVAGNTSIFSGSGRRYYLKAAELPEYPRAHRGEQVIDFGVDDTIAQVVVVD